MIKTNPESERNLLPLEFPRFEAVKTYKPRLYLRVWREYILDYLVGRFHDFLGLRKNRLMV